MNSKCQQTLNKPNLIPPNLPLIKGGVLGTKKPPYGGFFTIQELMYKHIHKVTDFLNGSICIGR